MENKKVLCNIFILHFKWHIVQTIEEAAKKARIDAKTYLSSAILFLICFCMVAWVRICRTLVSRRREWIFQGAKSYRSRILTTLRECCADGHQKREKQSIDRFSSGLCFADLMAEPIYNAILFALLLLWVLHIWNVLSYNCVHSLEIFVTLYATSKCAWWKRQKLIIWGK